ncbi:hypothetical protein Ancab_036387 [Ancistrocladus abbreviatus]
MLEDPVKSSEHDESNCTSFSVSIPCSMPENSGCKVKLVNHGSHIEKDAMEVAYEGEDELDDKSPIRREDSDCYLQVHKCNFGNEEFQLRNTSMSFSDSFASAVKKHFGGKGEIKVDNGFDMTRNGHLSDHGMARVEYWGPQVQPLLLKLGYE